MNMNKKQKAIVLFSIILLAVISFAMILNIYNINFVIAQRKMDLYEGWNNVIFTEDELSRCLSDNPDEVFYFCYPVNSIELASQQDINGILLKWEQGKESNTLLHILPNQICRVFVNKDCIFVIRS